MKLKNSEEIKFERNWLLTIFITLTFNEPTFKKITYTTYQIIRNKKDSTEESKARAWFHIIVESINLEINQTSILIVLWGEEGASAFALQIIYFKYEFSNVNFCNEYYRLLPWSTWPYIEFIISLIDGCQAETPDIIEDTTYKTPIIKASCISNSDIFVHLTVRIERLDRLLIRSIEQFSTSKIRITETPYIEGSLNCNILFVQFQASSRKGMNGQMDTYSRHVKLRIVGDFWGIGVEAFDRNGNGRPRQHQQKPEDSCSISFNALLFVQKNCVSCFFSTF